MTTAEVSRVARADQTFEIAVDRVPERGPTLSLESNDKCPPSENVDAVCTGEPVVTSMVSLESVPGWRLLMYEVLCRVFLMILGSALVRISVESMD